VANLDWIKTTCYFLCFILCYIISHKKSNRPHKKKKKQKMHLDSLSFRFLFAYGKMICCCCCCCFCQTLVTMVDVVQWLCSVERAETTSMSWHVDLCANVAITFFNRLFYNNQLFSSYWKGINIHSLIFFFFYNSLSLGQ